MARDRRKILEYFESESLAVKYGYVDEQVVARELPAAVAAIEGPDCRATWELSSLLGLELWLEVFFGEGVKSESATGSLPDDRDRGER